MSLTTLASILNAEVASKTLPHATSTKTIGTPLPLSATPTYRLLYRGALSLPDSHLQLDGLTFFANLASPAKSTQGAFNLLQNPLALALESMRGRPSLRFLCSISVPLEPDNHGPWVDESGGVELEVHPLAILTRIYFENMFCLTFWPSNSTSTAGVSATGRSLVGIKVALGDSDGPETTQIVIFARPPSSASTTAIRLTVARLSHQPPQVQYRQPRPDDPIPRRPPSFVERDQKRSSGLKRVSSRSNQDLKRRASGDVDSSTNDKIVPPRINQPQRLIKKQRILADLGSSVRVGLAEDASSTKDGFEFKVPHLPPAKESVMGDKTKGKQKEEDVFGDLTPLEDLVTHASDVHSHGKGKRNLPNENVERANKNVIKKATIEYLARTKDPSGRIFDKSHAEFREMYGFVYRGVGFALRAQMCLNSIDSIVVKRLIGIHVKMYASQESDNSMKNS